jgi:hypothetical protein
MWKTGSLIGRPKLMSKLSPNAKRKNKDLNDEDNQNKTSSNPWREKK